MAVVMAVGMKESGWFVMELTLNAPITLVEARSAVEVGSQDMLHMAADDVLSDSHASSRLKI